MGQDRAREEDIELIRDGLVPGLQAVDTFRFETPFTARRELPLSSSGLCVESVELSIVATDIKPSRYSRSG